MKKTFLLFLFIVSNALAQDPKDMPHADVTAVDISRSLSKDIFDLNGVPFMKPLVQAINATANSRFFSTAYIPTKVEKAYFRVSLNGMAGLIRDDMKTYTPRLPAEQFQDTSAIKFIKVDFLKGTITSIDTTNLVRYLFKTIIYDGIYGAKNIGGSQFITPKTINPPERAATILGKTDASFDLNGDAMVKIAGNRIDILNETYKGFGVKIISSALQDTINKILRKLPSRMTLPPGGDFNSLIAGVPQLEIGSYMGTELLVRFIPPVDMGTSIGKFSFYGLGIKHSISQYFDDPSFNLAVQAVYQGTSLTNKVGVTNSELKADARILNFNIHASKKIKDWFDVYCGLSIENVNIESTFSYKLSQEVQLSLGLLPPTTQTGIVVQPDPANGYPGDQVTQVSSLTLKDNNYKLVFGLHKEIGNFGISIDANISKFNILTSGIYYRF
jgi:hypothetical protein